MEIRHFGFKIFFINFFVIKITQDWSLMFICGNSVCRQASTVGIEEMEPYISMKNITPQHCWNIATALITE